MAVIGGGISGLATAALLATEGYQVTILEKQDVLGGRAYTFSEGGFRFDAGPSWYLMPEVIDHYFQLLGTSAAEQLELVKLDPGYRLISEGAPEPVDVPAGRQRVVELFERLEPGAGARLEKYLDSAAETYTMAKRRFLYPTFQSFAPLLRADVLARLPRLARLLLEPLHSYARRYVSNPGLQQILEYPAVFLGASPFTAPSMYHLMSHLDLDVGVYYPMGGFARLVEALEKQARDAGVMIRTSAEVLEIETAPIISRRRPAAVRGVRFRNGDGTQETLPADVVISAADLHHSETALLPQNLQTYPERYWQRRTAGPKRPAAVPGRPRRTAPAGAPHPPLHQGLGGELQGDLRQGHVHPVAGVNVRVQAQRHRSGRGAGRARECVRAGAHSAGPGAGRQRPPSPETRGRRRDRAAQRVGRHPGPGRADRGAADVRACGLRAGLPLVEGHLAGAGAHAEAECVLPGRQREPQGGGTVLRGGVHHSGDRHSHVPDQRRAGGEAAARGHQHRSPAGAAACGWRCGGNSFKRYDGVTAVAYLAFLVVSLGCMVLLDQRLRLFFWQDARRAAVVLAAGLVFFLAWDLAGIGLGIFFRGHNETIGIELAPELPLEEPVFLVFLCYLVMNLFQLFRRFLGARLPQADRVEERS